MKTGISEIGQPKVVLEIGAEGGSITILMRPGKSDKEEYSVRLRDQSLSFLQGDEADNEIRVETDWTDSWALAIATLARWRWPMLYPMFVDLDYRARVLSEVRRFRRYGEPVSDPDIQRWTKVCRPGAGS